MTVFGNPTCDKCGQMYTIVQGPVCGCYTKITATPVVNPGLMLQRNMFDGNDAHLLGGFDEWYKATYYGKDCPPIDMAKAAYAAGLERAAVIVGRVAEEPEEPEPAYALACYMISVAIREEITK